MFSAKSGKVSIEKNVLTLPAYSTIVLHSTK